MPTLKKKKKQQDDETVELDVGASFDAADAKDSDFDIDLDHAQYRGKSGQAGNRSRDSS